MSQIHNQGIPTRVWQGHMVTTDLPTLGTNPNSNEHGSATQEAKDLQVCETPGGQSARLGRTVRVEAADSPQGRGGRSEKANRTTSAAP
jgi:hypothetical protein